MAKLEIISRYPEKPPRGPALLCIHGAFCGAWIWDEHFLPYFAQHGYTAHALSLRGHGGSEGHDWLAMTSLAHYVDDVARAVEKLGQPTVLIGHSMGGVVVQKYLRDHATAGAVLMASGPPHGMLAAGIAMALTNPVLYMQLLLVQTLGPQAASSNLIRKAVFSDSVPDREVQRFFSLMQAESPWATFDLLWPTLHLSTRTPDVPVLVLGAERDYFVSPILVRATATAFGTRAKIFPDMAHAMMLEPGWQQVADRVLKWLTDIPEPISQLSVKHA